MDSSNTIYPFKHILYATPTSDRELVIRFQSTERSIPIYFKDFDAREEQLQNFKKYLTMDSPL